MWPVVVGVGAFVSAVLLRIVDLVIEGRGSWVRRSIAADVALLNQLDESLRAGEAGKALERRVSEALVLFGAADVDADEEQKRVRQFDRDVDHLEVRVHVVMLGLLVVAGLAPLFTDGRPAPSPSGQDWLVILGLATALAVLEMKSAKWIARSLVKRQWKRDGQRLPDRRKRAHSSSS